MSDESDPMHQALMRMVHEGTGKKRSKMRVTVDVCGDDDEEEEDSEEETD